MKKYERDKIYPVVIYGKEGMEPEEFRPVTYPGVVPGMYEVSNYGQVNRILDNGSRVMMNMYHTNDWHLTVGLRNEDGSLKTTLVHRIVANEFVEFDPRPDANIINHKNAIPFYNYYKNLEYCTDLENKAHAKAMGIFPKGEENGNNRFTENQVREICELFEKGMTKAQVREVLGVKKSENRPMYDLIRFVYNKETWTHISKEYDF